MSKSAIYTANTSAQTVAVNDIIPVGTTSRRFGCNIRQDGNAITLLGQGYYHVTVSASAERQSRSQRSRSGNSCTALLFFRDRSVQDERPNRQLLFVRIRSQNY